MRAGLHIFRTERVQRVNRRRRFGRRDFEAFQADGLSQGHGRGEPRDTGATSKLKHSYATERVVLRLSAALCLLSSRRFLALAWFSRGLAFFDLSLLGLQTLLSELLA